jgi:hypothetical protein
MRQPTQLSDYLLEATEILAARRQELESIVKELQKKWQGSNSFLSQYAPAI